MIAPSLIAIFFVSSASVIFALGALHLIFTFRSNRFHPRDAALLVRLQEVSPIITRQTSMWKAWVGFNASHSYGAILFGLIYGYLALIQPVVLLSSWFLMPLGLVVLFAYLFLAWRYWFSTPFWGIVIAIVFYVLGLIVNLT